jgi:nucleoside-diphosphate-sugar epimerase
MSKKVLITGASGFVGYHLISEALKAGFDVYAAVRKSSDISHLTAFDIKYIDLSYDSVASLTRQLETEQFEYIIHAAGITKAKTFDAYKKVNAGYSKNLAEAAVAANIPLKKFVFVSSLAALGPLPELTGSIADDAVGKPVTSYGASKLLAEEYLKNIPSLPLITIRPTAVYGPREKDIFILFKSINGGLEPHIGKFEQHLSFIYVKDLARVIVQALQSEVVGKQYNVSDGKVYDRYKLAMLCKNALKKKTIQFHLPLKIVSLMAGLMDILYKNSSSTPALNKEKMAELTAVNWKCDIANAVRDLGYEPQYDLENGMNETIKWYKANRWL